MSVVPSKAGSSKKNFQNEDQPLLNNKAPIYRQAETANRSDATSTRSVNQLESTILLASIKTELLEKTPSTLKCASLLIKTLAVSDNGQFLLGLSQEHSLLLFNLEVETTSTDPGSGQFALDFSPARTDLYTFTPKGSHLFVMSADQMSVFECSTGNVVSVIPLSSIPKIGTNDKLEPNLTENIKSEVVGKTKKTTKSNWLLARCFDLRNSLSTLNSYHVELVEPRLLAVLGRDAIYLFKLDFQKSFESLKHQCCCFVPDNYEALLQDSESVLMLDPFILVADKTKLNQIVVAQLNQDFLQLLYSQTSLFGEGQAHPEVPISVDRKCSLSVAEAGNIFCHKVPSFQRWFLYYDTSKAQIQKVALSDITIPAVTSVYSGTCLHFSLTDQSRFLSVTQDSENSCTSLVVLHHHNGEYIQVNEHPHPHFEVRSEAVYVRSRNLLLILGGKNIYQVPLELPRPITISLPLSETEPFNAVPEKQFTQINRFIKEDSLVQLTKDRRRLFVFGFTPSTLFLLEKGKLLHTFKVPGCEVSPSRLTKHSTKGQQPHKILFDKNESRLFVRALKPDNPHDMEDETSPLTDCLQYLDLESLIFHSCDQHLQNVMNILEILPGHVLVRSHDGKVLKKDLDTWNSQEIVEEPGFNHWSYSEGYLLAGKAYSQTTASETLFAKQATVLDQIGRASC